MEYVNQKEYPYWLYNTRLGQCDEEKEKGKTTTIASSGCGLCSAVMVAHRLIPRCEFSLKDAVRISYETHSNMGKGTTYKTFIPTFAQELGLDYEMTNDPERLLYCLRTGGVAVCHTKGNREGYTGVFSIGGHYFLAINEERDGRIATLDPAYVEGRYSGEGKDGLVEMTHGFVGLSSLETIIKDTEPAEFSFYLFWRK